MGGADNNKLQRMYEEHHARRKKFGTSFEEERRGCLFKAWIGTGKEVLDLGCRDGTLTRHYAEGNHVTGMDIDGNALEKAREELGIRTMQSDIGQPLPFPDGSFDVVVMAEILEHLPYPRLILPEAMRVLKGDGLFIGSVPIYFHMKNRIRILLGKRIGYDPTHCQYFSISSLEELLGKYLSVEEMVALKGERWARFSMAFARNVAFKCRKPSGGVDRTQAVSG